MQYKITYDQNVKIITTLFLLIILLFLYKTFNYTYSFYLLLFLFFVAAIYIMYNFPLFLKVKNDTLIIKTILRNIKIDKKDILSVKKINFTQVSMTFSTKGVFGYLGETMDNNVSLITDRKNIVLIKTSTSSYMISIENYDQLKHTLNL